MAQSKVKPIRQGDIDGLCGVYACINAILRHHRPLDDYDRQCELFEKAVGPIYDTCKVTGGAEIDSVTRVLDSFKCALKDEVRIETETFCHLDKSVPFDRWIKSLNLNSKHDALIIGFEGFDSHWTVIDSVHKNYVGLFDSYTYRRFDLHNIVWGPHKDQTKIIVNPSDLIKVTVKPKE